MKDQTTDEQILKACKGLRKRYGKRKWFAELRIGPVDGKRTIFMTSKTTPPASRVNQCVEYHGIPVIVVKEPDIWVGTKPVDFSGKQESP